MLVVRMVADGTNNKTNKQAKHKQRNKETNKETNKQHTVTITHILKITNSMQ